VELHSVASPISKDLGPRLQQGVEGRMSALNKWMRRRGQVDWLTSQHVQLLGRLSEPLEVRQVRMKVERRNSIQKTKTIMLWFRFDWRRRAVRSMSGP
jgi:hypothetical protein